MRKGAGRSHFTVTLYPDCDVLGDGQGEESALFSTQTEQLMPACAGATTAEWSAPVGTEDVLRLHAEL